MRYFVILVSLAATVCGQNQSTMPVEQEPHHHQIFQNARTRVFLVELAPGEEMPMHLHERGYIGVMLTNAQLTITTVGKPPVKAHVAAGTIGRYVPAPLIHSAINDSPAPVRSLDIELAEPQGATKPSKQPPSHYCNPGSKTACVDEKYLFCTDKVCVSDVTMGEDAITMKHSHATDHMIVALTDYRLSDNVEGKGTNVRVQQSGSVEYIPAGITHQLTNISQHPVRFLVMVFR